MIYVYKSYSTGRESVLLQIMLTTCSYQCKISRSPPISQDEKGCKQLKLHSNMATQQVKA